MFYSATQVKEATKSGLNLFSNDGSFLDQFKQLNNKKKDPKFKTFNKYKDKVREKEKEKEKDKVEDKLVEVPKSDK